MKYIKSIVGYCADDDDDNNNNVCGAALSFNNAV